MNEILIRISSVLYNNSSVLVNGKREKFNPNGRGSYELNVQADDSTEIQIVRRHELLSPMWLFWGLLFFIISCFGIFDVPYSKKSALSCKVKVSPSAGGVVQFTPNNKKDGTAVLVETSNCAVDVLENTLDDTIIKKRRKALRIIKLLLWLALIVAIILIVVL